MNLEHLLFMVIRQCHYYYIVCIDSGLESEPKLPASLVPALYKFILIVNLNPVRVKRFPFICLWSNFFHLCQFCVYAISFLNCWHNSNVQFLLLLNGDPWFSICLKNYCLFALCFYKLKGEWRAFGFLCSMCWSVTLFTVHTMLCTVRWLLGRVWSEGSLWSWVRFSVGQESRWEWRKTCARHVWKRRLFVVAKHEERRRGFVVTSGDSFG